MGKVLYVLTWPLSAIVLRVFQGSKVERKARKLQAEAYVASIRHA